MDPLAELLDQLRAPWKLDSACLEHPELSWFPERGEDQSRQKAVCSACLVRVECLAAGVGQLGIWGGISERARRKNDIAA